MNVTVLVFLAMIAGLGAAQPVTGPARSVPRPSVVVLWGTWCASCRDELARLASLRQAAAPLPIVTLAIDPPAKALERLRATHMPVDAAFADAREPGAVLADWGGKGAILPLAVAIDRNGNVCGSKRGLLGTDQLRGWATSCSR